MVDRGSEGLLPVMEVNAPVVGFPFARVSLESRRMQFYIGYFLWLTLGSS